MTISDIIKSLKEIYGSGYFNVTVPSERYRAVKYAREFLQELCDPKLTPKVPKKYRQRALNILRHYPGEYDMKQAAAFSIGVFDPGEGNNE